MNIVVAFDSFKDCMSAKEASLSALEAIKDYDSSIDVVICPMADGGEGTMEALLTSVNGIKMMYEVHGPLMDIMMAPILYYEDKAIIECAKVCGLELLEDSQRDPLKTTSYGLGELMIEAVNHGAKELLVCLGGSATNDGGIGMLSALGVHFLDEEGHSVACNLSGLDKIASIDISSFNPLMKDIKVVAVCDVTNPLCGANGASAIYGPQKGLVDVKSADIAMYHYASLLSSLLGINRIDTVGSGAAGGLGFALLSFFDASFISGFDLICEYVGLKQAIANCDLVIVGEGRMDQQTQYGKTPFGVLTIAKQFNKDVYGFAGRLCDEDILNSLGFKRLYAITPSDIDLKTALLLGKDYLRECIYSHMEDLLDGI